MIRPSNVAEAADFSFVLANASLQFNAETDTLTTIERASLVGGASNNLFTVSGWTGQATLNGGAGSDTVFSSNNTNFVLSNALLTRSDGASFTLAGFERAVLTGGAGNNSFTVSGWTGTANLNGGGGTDTVISVVNANFALSDSALFVSNGAVFSLAGITRASLTGGAGNNIIDASQFTLGPVTLNGGAGNDVINGGSQNDVLIGGTGNDTSMDRGKAFRMTQRNRRRASTPSSASRRGVRRSTMAHTPARSAAGKRASTWRYSPARHGW